MTYQINPLGKDGPHFISSFRDALAATGQKHHIQLSVSGVGAGLYARYSVGGKHDFLRCLSFPAMVPTILALTPTSLALNLFLH